MLKCPAQNASKILGLFLAKLSVSNSMNMEFRHNYKGFDFSHRTREDQAYNFNGLKM